jgi:protein involved in polysaccharide export with SLBB domain
MSISDLFRLRAPSALVMCALMLLTSLAAGQESPSDENVIDVTPMSESRYRIMVGDSIDVSFFKSDTLNRSLTVGPDGDIFLPLVGRVRVAGRTLEEINEELNERYRSELTDPQVSVSILDYAGLAVYVGGEVNEPGLIDYRGGLTAVQAIMNAGGFTTTASLSNVLLIRKDQNNEPVGAIVNVKDILHDAQFDLDLPLAPTDVIFVPRSKIANVNLFVRQYIDNNIPQVFGYFLYRR